MRAFLILFLFLFLHVKVIIITINIVLFCISEVHLPELTSVLVSLSSHLRPQISWGRWFPVPVKAFSLHSLLPHAYTQDGGLYRSEDVILPLGFLCAVFMNYCFFFMNYCTEMNWMGWIRMAYCKLEYNCTELDST